MKKRVLNIALVMMMLLSLLTFPVAAKFVPSEIIDTSDISNNFKTTSMSVDEYIQWLYAQGQRNTVLNSASSSTNTQNSTSTSSSNPYVFTPDIQALYALAKESIYTGMSYSSAEIMVEWAREYGLNYNQVRIDSGHANGTNAVTQNTHLNFASYHIPIW